MDLIKTYGNIIKNNINNTSKCFNLIKTGLTLEEKRTKLFPDKNLPSSLQYLNQICLKFVLEPLRNPDNYFLVNLFAPTEILHAMDIYPMFLEAFSSFLSGLKVEDKFIDQCENSGISETLCSYHKAFIGAVESNILPKPKLCISSSMICDANINTFRYCSSKYNIPNYIIDIPYEYSSDAEIYVSNQLEELIKLIEDTVHRKLDLNKLKEVINRENKSKYYLQKYYEEMSNRYMVNTLTIEMYKIFASHVSLGRKETLNFYEMFYKDSKNMPIINNHKNKRILWVHLLPFYHDILKDYFNFSKEYEIITCDLNFDYMYELDVDNPLNSIAKKALLNQYNGNYERKINNIIHMCKLLNIDAVVHFCQFGCKQSSGGIMLLKEALKKENIPFLSIDGDAVDRRNTPNEQIKTRMEAFFEILNNESR